MNRDQWYQKRSQFDENSLALADDSHVTGGKGEVDEATVVGTASGFSDRQVNHNELTCCEWAAGLQVDSAESEKVGSDGSHYPASKSLPAHRSKI